MSEKTYNTISGLVFAVVAAGHAVRAYNSWNLTIYEFAMPVWASWVAVIFLAYLSYQGFRKNK